MNNDILAQYIKVCEPVTREQEIKRINEIKACTHEFVIIEKSKRTLDADTIECIHCGLTNKYIKMMEMIEPYFSGLYDVYFSSKIEPFESMLFKGFLNGVSYDNINFISNVELDSDYPKLLYDIALSIKPEASSQELFLIMEELNSLQTRRERLKTCTLKDAEPLIVRYKNIHKTVEVQKIKKCIKSDINS